MAQALEAAEAQRIAATVTHASTKDLDLGKIKPFAGKPHTLEKFLLDCKLHFILKPDVYNSDDRKVSFILSHMEGDAAGWKEQYFESRNDKTLVAEDGLEGFLTELRNSFAEPHRKENALKTLQNIRQGKDSVDTHNVNFKLLVEKAGLSQAHNNDILCNIYMNSLNSNIKDRIIMLEEVPTTLDKWYSKAAYFANAFERLKQGTWMTGSTGNKYEKKKKGGYYHNKEKEKDHDAMEVDGMTIEERKKRLRDGACFICNEQGHFSNACPKRKKKPQDNKRNGNGKTHTPDKRKKRMNPRDFKTHIREMVIKNFDDAKELESFMDMVEEEGFQNRRTIIRRSSLLLFLLIAHLYPGDTINDSIYPLFSHRVAILRKTKSEP